MKASWRCPLAALLALPCVWASEAGSALLFIAQERDAGMLHVAQKALRDEDIRMPELMEIHQRMMGRTPRAFEQPLPHVDVFERPQARLVFMVDGLSGGWHTPFVNELHRDHFHCRVQGVKGLKDVAVAYTSREDGVSSSVGSGGVVVPQRHVCVASDPALRSTGLCGEGAFQVDPSLEELDMSALLAFDHKDVEIFRPEYEQADRYFLSEVQSLLRLPSLSSFQADNYLVFSDGLKQLEMRYGRHSIKFAAGRRLLDHAMRASLQALSDLHRGKLLSQIVLTEQAPAAHDVHRRLAAATNATTNVTMEQIASVNIITWTSVGLVVVLLFVMSALLAADSGPKDSLLYARFQADTSGGKMD